LLVQNPELREKNHHTFYDVLIFHIEEFIFK